MSPSKPAKKERLICRCLGVTESKLYDAVQNQQVQTVEDVTRHTQAGDGCTACHPLIQRYLARLRKKTA